MGYYGFFFRKFAFAQTKENPTFQPPVSVIIACHNEADNLKKNHQFWIQQNYNSFEIILIDDTSTDETWKEIQKISHENLNVKAIQIPQSPNYFGNKKNALTQGIENTKNEYLLFIDADTFPVTKNWINVMAQGFFGGYQIVLGYGKYENHNGFLNKIIRYETLLTAWQYFSYAINGLPYMGVGRNLAYTKKIFKENNGFQSHSHIQSGDDDLFVSQNANRLNTNIVCNENSHTISTPKKSWREWIQQKRRHITTANVYSKKHQFLLGLFYISQVLFYFLSIFLLFSAYGLKFVIFMVVLRFIAYYFTLIPVAKKLRESNLIVIAPFLELNLILFQGIIFVLNLIKKPTNW